MTKEAMTNNQRHLHYVRDDWELFVHMWCVLGWHVQHDVEFPRPNELCPASGTEPNFSRFSEFTRTHYSGCSCCDGEWDEKLLVNGKLPSHRPIEHGQY